MPTQTDFEKAVNVCRRVDLERLIQMKRAAGRPKDFEVLGQLQALLEERRNWPHTSPEDPQ